jgi:hypothetical protein
MAGLRRMENGRGGPLPDISGFRKSPAVQIVESGGTPFETGSVHLIPSEVRAPSERGSLERPREKGDGSESPQ